MHPLRLARGRGDLIIRRHSGRSGCVRFPAIMTYARDARCGVPHARDARRGGAHARDGRHGALTAGRTPRGRPRPGLGGGAWFRPLGRVPGATRRAVWWPRTCSGSPRSSALGPSLPLAPAAFASARHGTAAASYVRSFRPGGLCPVFPAERVR